MSFIFSPFISCFHPSKTTNHHHSPPLSSNPNYTTYVYQTNSGTVSLTWSRSILGRTLHVNLHHHHPFDSSSFHLHIKPFVFWKKQGTKKLSHNTLLFWNLSKARFGSKPEPHSKFYVALVVNHELTLLVGDISNRDARAKIKARHTKNPQVLVMKREHVEVEAQQQHHHKLYSTKTRLGEKVREIEIDCEGHENIGNNNNNSNDMRLLFRVDGESVLEVKRLKWKFRGNERVEVDGVHVQISWDVHDWLFDKENGGGKNNNSDGGCGVFMFKFEENEVRGNNREEVVNHWNWNLGSCEFGKMGKSWSSSSLSMSSSAGSFGGSSSVMEWSSVEENELVVPLGFSLLVYAWKR